VGWVVSVFGNRRVWQGSLLSLRRLLRRPLRRLLRRHRHRRLHLHLRHHRPFLRTVLLQSPTLLLMILRPFWREPSGPLPWEPLASHQTLRILPQIRPHLNPRPKRSFHLHQSHSLLLKNLQPHSLFLLHQKATPLH